MPTVKQLSVFAENKPGRLARVAEALGEAGINIRALSIAEAGDFGIIRMIVDDPERALQYLKERGFAATLTDVLAVEMLDEPGGLARVARILGDNQVNIEYAYAFVEKSRERAVLIIRVDNAEKAEEILRKSGVNVLGPEDIYKI